MTLDQLRASINSIIRDAEHKLASLAPDDPNTLCSMIQLRWPDADEVSEQVRGECAWIQSQAQTKEDETNERPKENLH